MEVGHQNTSYVCLDGAERFISGDVDDDGCTALPEEAASLVDSAAEEDAELWAGYPAVVLTGPRPDAPGGTRSSRRFWYAVSRSSMARAR